MPVNEVDDEREVLPVTSGEWKLYEWLFEHRLKKYFARMQPFLQQDTECTIGTKSSEHVGKVASSPSPDPCTPETPRSEVHDVRSRERVSSSSTVASPDSNGSCSPLPELSDQDQVRQENPAPLRPLVLRLETSRLLEMGMSAGPINKLARLCGCVVPALLSDGNGNYSPNPALRSFSIDLSSITSVAAKRSQTLAGASRHPNNARLRRHSSTNLSRYAHILSPQVGQNSWGYGIGLGGTPNDVPQSAPPLAHNQYQARSMSNQRFFCPPAPSQLTLAPSPQVQSSSQWLPNEESCSSRNVSGHGEFLDHCYQPNLIPNVPETSENPTYKGDQTTKIDIEDIPLNALSITEAEQASDETAKSWECAPVHMYSEVNAAFGERPHECLGEDTNRHVLGTFSTGQTWSPTQVFVAQNPSSMNLVQAQPPSHTLTPATVVAVQIPFMAVPANAFTLLALAPATATMVTNAPPSACPFCAVGGAAVAHAPTALTLCAPGSTFPLLTPSCANAAFLATPPILPPQPPPPSPSPSCNLIYAIPYCAPSFPLEHPNALPSHKQSSVFGSPPFS